MLLPQLPALSHFFRLSPSDVEDMTLREISEFIAYLERHNRETEGAMKRGA